jgi:hypothetical protein
VARHDDWTSYARRPGAPYGIRTVRVPWGVPAFYVVLALVVAGAAWLALGAVRGRR